MLLGWISISISVASLIRERLGSAPFPSWWELLISHIHKIVTLLEMSEEKDVNKQDCLWLILNP
jgi:hypothetical protein